MGKAKWTVLAASALLLIWNVRLGAQTPPLPEQPNNGLGDTDLDIIPGQKWRVHDLARPHPQAVVPGGQPGQAPSDAIVLFEGKDLSQWTVSRMPGAGETPAKTWKVEKGYVKVVPGAGSLTTKERFRDIQLHLEWAAPARVNSYAQYRGNSGIMLNGRYEIQLLDSYQNVTYADGQLGSIYGQWPPLVNPARKPGEWQSFDIFFEAPVYEGEKLVKSPYVTVILNGLLLHHHQEILTNVSPGGRRGGSAAGNGGTPAGGRPGGGRGPMGPPTSDGPISLQGHPSVVENTGSRFRNIWVRKLTPYDQPER